MMQNFVKEGPMRMDDRGEHASSTDETTERYTVLGDMRNEWEDKQRAVKKKKDATTADRIRNKVQAS